MEKNAKKVKLIIVAAVAIIALLLVTVIAQIITIHKKQKLNEAQQAEISKLYAEKEYYENLKNENSEDDKNLGTEIIVEQGE